MWPLLDVVARDVVLRGVASRGVAFLGVVLRDVAQSYCQCDEEDVSSEDDQHLQDESEGTNESSLEDFIDRSCESNPPLPENLQELFSTDMPVVVRSATGIVYMGPWATASKTWSKIFAGSKGFGDFANKPFSLLSIRHQAMLIVSTVVVQASFKQSVRG